MSKTVTASLMGDPPPGRTPWAPPTPPEKIVRASPRLGEDRATTSVGATVLDGVLAVEASPPPAPAGTPGADERESVVLGIMMGASPDLGRPDHLADAGNMITAATLRPVAPICAAGIEPRDPPTAEPMLEWMAPGDLLIEGAYQRDLSAKSLKLIRRIVAQWDWRRFKPPVVAWTEAGFEIIDGQHTAIAAATHPAIHRIPVLVVEAAELKDRASAFIGHNKDRLAVSAVQMHQAAAAAGDVDAQTIQQVCERAGLKLITGAWGGYAWQAGDTVAVGAISTLISKRGAQKARMILQVLSSAGCAPVAANDIKAADLLFSSPDFAEDLEPLPEGGADLALAIRALGGNGPKEAKEYAALKCLPLWKAQAAVWFRKTRKRRRSA